MLKKFWGAIKRPLWKATKFTAVSSLAISVIAVFVQLISLITGNIGVGEGLQGILQTYLFAFSFQLFLYTPWIFLYGGVKLFFQWLFPKEVVTEEIKKEETPNPASTTNDAISLRKTALQTTILSVLEQHKEELDFEDVHLLERINEEILTKTEMYYSVLHDKAKQQYKQDILQRFNELEIKVQEVKEKITRQQERQLDKQLHIIDQITK